MSHPISLPGEAPISIQALKTRCGAPSVHQPFLPMKSEDADINRPDQIVCSLMA